MITALYTFNVVFFTFLSVVWRPSSLIDILIKMLAIGGVLANLLTLMIHIGFIVRG